MIYALVYNKIMRYMLNCNILIRGFVKNGK